VSDAVKLIEVKEDIQADNERVARELRARLAARKTFLLNVMSGPGAGKTSTILRTVEELRGRWRFGVLEADIESTVDAERVAACGIRAVQLRTGGLCHLDATMVEQGLEALGLDGLDVVIIENVGNLVCPAEFDTGAMRNVMLLSVPEGDDKPLKYPLMFSVVDALLIKQGRLSDALRLRHRRSSRTGAEDQSARARLRDLGEDRPGVREWAEWLRGEVETVVGSAAQAESHPGRA